ncbi:MAG: hypothetical protein Q9184_006193 [Pyrenodesmia sp. 2 TL-2023]
MSWYLDRQSMSVSPYKSKRAYEFYPYGCLATDASQQRIFREHNYAEYNRFGTHVYAVDILRSYIRLKTPSWDCEDSALLLWKGYMKQLNEKIGWVQEKLDGVSGDIEHAFVNSLR